MTLRVAVQQGASAVRVAAVEDDREPVLLAALPQPWPGFARLVADLLGERPDELVVVHPGWWALPRVCVTLAGAAPCAGWVRGVPAGTAALGAARDGVVLDVGATGAEASLVAAGRLVRCHLAPGGGDALDRAMGVARGVREAASLLPDGRLDDGLAELLGDAVEALRRVLLEPAPVLLVGGVARTPLLAELVDAAVPVGCEVRVAQRPEAAAVLGALLCTPRRSGGGSAGRDARFADARTAGGDASRAAVVGSVVAGWAGDGSVGARAGPNGAGAPRRLPPVPVGPRRRLRIVACVGVALAVAAGLLHLGVRLAAEPSAPPAGVLVQYGYRVGLPAGWAHTGGLPERRRTLLTPVATPDGSDLIAVERSDLGYDTAAEPARAAAELRAVFDRAVAAGSELSDYAAVDFGGRAVASYRELDPAGPIDWYVVLDGPAQLSVGCRATPAGAAAVRAACATVVGSVGVV